MIEFIYAITSVCSRSWLAAETGGPTLSGDIRHSEDFTPLSGKASAWLNDSPTARFEERPLSEPLIRREKGCAKLRIPTGMLPLITIQNGH